MSSLTTLPDAEESEAAGWWETCTTAQLKNIVAAGIAGGDRFVEAVREIERRSSASRSATESRETERKRRRKRQNRQLRMALAAGAAILLIVLALLIANRV